MLMVFLVKQAYHIPFRGPPSGSQMHYVAGLLDEASELYALLKLS